MPSRMRSSPRMAVARSEGVAPRRRGSQTVFTTGVVTNRPREPPRKVPRPGVLCPAAFATRIGRRTPPLSADFPAPSAQGDGTMRCRLGALLLLPALVLTPAAAQPPEARDRTPLDD